MENLRCIVLVVLENKYIIKLSSNIILARSPVSSDHDVWDRLPELLNFVWVNSV
jgi:hypothetical protein